MGNGRVGGHAAPGMVSNAAPGMAGSGPGSYNRERDQERGIFHILYIFVSFYLMSQVTAFIVLQLKRNELLPATPLKR